MARQSKEKDREELLKELEHLRVAYEALRQERAALAAEHSAVLRVRFGHSICEVVDFAAADARARQGRDEVRRELEALRASLVPERTEMRAEIDSLRYNSSLCGVLTLVISVCITRMEMYLFAHRLIDSRRDLDNMEKDRNLLQQQLCSTIGLQQEDAEIKRVYHKDTPISQPEYVIHMSRLL